MKCCRSCKYWDKASKKVPIDVVKVIDKENFIVFRFGSKEAKVPSWKWVPKDLSKYYLAKFMRVCFYGKGIVLPWDECEYYEAKFGDKLYCDISKCEYSNYCPKFKSSKTFYIT